MAIDSYTALQAHIVSDMELDASTVAVLPELIQRAESELDRLLLTPQREKVATAATVADSRVLALPSDFRQIRSILVDSDYPLAQVTMNVLLGEFTGSGKPQVFTVADEAFYFGPIPDAAYTISLTYMAGLEALSLTNASNWLLERHPDAYVCATMKQVEMRLANDARLPMLETWLREITDQINKQGNRFRNSAPMRLRSPVVI